MKRPYKLSLVERMSLAAVVIFQTVLYCYSMRTLFLKPQRLNAFDLHKLLTMHGASLTILAFVMHYAHIHQVLEEVRQADKLFELLQPTKSTRKFSYTVIRTWLLGSTFLVLLLVYWVLHCVERFCHAEKSWSLSTAFNLCSIKLLVILEFNFILYYFVDITLLLTRRLSLVNRAMAARQSQASSCPLSFYNASISEREVSLLLLLYARLYHIQRRLLHCFRLPLLAFFSNNIYSLTFVSLTAYNMYFHGSCSFMYASACEFLLRAALCYGIILTCVLCCREAEQISINMQRCERSGSSDVKFFLMELQDRKFKFEIYRLFSLDFDTFLSMMGIICTYIVILIQFKADTIQNDIEK